MITVFILVMAEYSILIAMSVVAKSFVSDNIKFVDSKHSIRVALLIHASGWLTTRGRVSSYLKSVLYIYFVVSIFIDVCACNPIRISISN